MMGLFDLHIQVLGGDKFDHPFAASLRESRKLEVHRYGGESAMDWHRCLKNLVAVREATRWPAERTRIRLEWPRLPDTTTQGCASFCQSHILADT